jgi:TRAP-type mannitol/chloroaromatic compound transport system substrate-binding protein
MGMYTPFYIANAAASANVTNVSGGQALILPANAVVTSVSVTTAGTSGTINMGFTPISGVGPGQTTTLGTNVPTGLLANAAVTRGTVALGSATGGASLGNVANATNLVVVTSASNTTGLGTVTGLIHYFVYDTGTQVV